MRNGGRPSLMCRIVRIQSDFEKLWVDMKKPGISKEKTDESSPEEIGIKIAEKINDITDREMSVKEKQLLAHFIEYYPLRHFFLPKSVRRLGPAFKKRGGRYSKSTLAKCFLKICPIWKERLFVLTTEGFGYADNFEDKNLKDSIFLDRSLMIYASKLCNNKSLTFIVRTSSRKMKMKVNGLLAGFCWLEAFVSAVTQSRYCCIHIHNSFAPIARESFSKWYINGKDYFIDVAEAMDKATSKIYITGWMLSPGFYMKRPVNPMDPDNKYRLDQILLRAAKRGVKVYILLYKEFEHALPNNSQHAREYLMSLDKNISVIRHPKDMIMLWSHHEKLVVVDCSKGFMGGLDLCYGRYDTSKHYLCEQADISPYVVFPGQDYNNVRLKDFKDVHNWDLTLIDKQSQPRMPWRDIGIQLRGEIVKDMARHFIQYWNFASIQIMSRKEGGHLGKGSLEKKLSKASTPVHIYAKQGSDREDSSEDEIQEPKIKRFSMQTKKAENVNTSAFVPFIDPANKPLKPNSLSKLRVSLFEFAVNPEFHMMKIHKIQKEKDNKKLEKTKKRITYISGEHKNSKVSLNLDPEHIGTIIMDRRKGSSQDPSSRLNTLPKNKIPKTLLNLQSIREKNDDLSTFNAKWPYSENLDLAKLLVDAIMHEE